MGVTAHPARLKVGSPDYIIAATVAALRARPEVKGGNSVVFFTDPEGNTTQHLLKELGYSVDSVGVSKAYSVILEASSVKDARAKAEELRSRTDMDGQTRPKRDDSAT